MRPLFTVHAGEYIVGDYIEGRFRDLRVWIPSKDDGVDLLVTDRAHRKVASLQVKFSKDHLAAGADRNATQAIKSGGWWKFDLSKIATSPADYWVLVLCEFTKRRYDFVIIDPRELARRYRSISRDSATIQSYFWVTRSGKCWETRGLTSKELSKVCQDSYTRKTRDFSQFLNVWPFANA